MMFFAKQGIKNMIRSKKTSVLLFLVLLLLTILIGTSYTASTIISSYVDTCNESYHTLGIVDFPTADLTNPASYDESVNSIFEQTNEVMEAQDSSSYSWHPTALSIGSVEGLSRTDKNIPLSNEAVLVVSVNKMQEIPTDGNYICTVKESLSSTKELERNYLYVISENTPLELGHTYLVHGSFSNVNSAFSYLTITEFNHPLAQADGFNGSLDQMLQDITTESGDYQIPENSPFLRMAEALNVIHNSVSVHHTSNLDYEYEYQQNILQLTDGENFQQADYENNAKVCMISTKLADQLGATVGEKIHLSQAVNENTSPEMSYWPTFAYQEEDSYTITGIFSADVESGYYVYVPFDGKNVEKYSHYSNTLGQIYFQNESAQTDAQEIAEQLPNGVALTLYDQGYEAVMMPLQEILQIITIIDIIVVIASVLFFLLFGYLFVIKKKATARIMQLQGTGKRAIYVFFMAGGLGLSLPVAVIGGAINTLIASQLPKLVQYLMKNTHAIDYRFSNGNLSVQKEVEFATNGFMGNALLATLVVWLVTLLVCLFFTSFTWKERMKTHRIQSLFGKRQGKSKAGSGKHYALFSIARGKSRVALLMLVCALAMSLFAQLSSSLASAKANEDSLTSNTEIEGYFTDIHGRNCYDMTIDLNDMKALYQTGYLDDMYYSNTFKCQFWAMGTGDKFEEEYQRLTDYQNANEFRTQILGDAITRSGDNLILTTDFDHTREFLNNGHPDVTFMDGLTEEEFFAGKDQKEYAVVSENYLKKNGYKLGDELYLAVKTSDYWITMFHIIIAGSYQQLSNVNNIYMTLNQQIPRDEMVGDKELEDYLQGWAVDAGMFSLHADQLGALKDALSDMGYTDVNDAGSLRKYVAIKDNQLINTKKSMRQQLQYMQVFFPIIEVLLEIMGFLIPILLIRSRKSEIVIMRNLGTSRRQTFWNLYLEQLLISVAGVVIAGVLVAVLHISLTLPAYLLIAGFFLAWNAGSIWSIGKYNQKKIAA